MGRAFCLPVFGRKMNKEKLQFPEPDGSLANVLSSRAVGTRRSQPQRTADVNYNRREAEALESPEPDVSSANSLSPSVACEAQMTAVVNLSSSDGHETAVAGEVVNVADVFSDPGVYGPEFSESCATSEEHSQTDNKNAVCSNAVEATSSVLDEHHRLDAGDEHDHEDVAVNEEIVEVDAQEPFEALGPGEESMFTLKRVEEWVQSIDPSRIDPLIEQETTTNQAARLHSGSSKDTELVNSVTRSLDYHSTVANLSGLGLTLIPNLSVFSHLKTLKLSANSIDKISPGVLPKGLHSLDLSRNKISIIEGLRELSKLRSLNLSYNRILRIGQGLANCSSIRELYLGFNKISEVEGLHRLTKLSYLDLSFNRVSSTKSLEQIAATYSSLMAVNLVGNPVVANVGEEHLKRFMTSMAPKLVFLNKQPVKGGASSRDAVLRSLVASSKTSPLHNASKRSNYASAGNTSSSALRSRTQQQRHHQHHDRQQQQQPPQRTPRLASLQRVRSDGALHDRQAA